LTEAGQIGRDDVEVIAEQRNQIAEHVTRARKAVQEKQFWRVFATCFAIEHLEAVYVFLLVPY
jgi:hypothetical protein